MSINPFRQARYLLSAHHIHQLPNDVGREVAFAGRSNAGKSSALNAITDQTRLAHTSKTPGRTQQINFFQLDTEHRLVDLPGYGYAKVPSSMREHWRKVIDAYLRNRESLVGVVLIMDIRHPLKEFDQLMLGFCTQIKLPCHCLLTKADKLTNNQANQALAKMTRELAAMQWSGTAQLFSAVSAQGADTVRTVLATWLELDNSSSTRSPES